MTCNVLLENEKNHWIPGILFQKIGSCHDENL